MHLMVKLGHSKSSFAKELEVSLPLITHITTGRNKPGLELIQRIMTKFPDIDPDWLINGQQSMFRQRMEQPDLSPYLARLEALKELAERPLKVQQTILDYHKILLDEVLHLQEMSIMVEHSGVDIRKLSSDIEKLAEELRWLYKDV